MRPFRLCFLTATSAVGFDSSIALPLFLRRGNAFSSLSTGSQENEEGGKQQQSDLHGIVVAFRWAMSRCSQLREKRCGDSVEPASLLDHVKTSIFLSPETMRRFWRVSVLRPEDMLHIIVGFGSTVADREVNFLLKLFIWARNQEGDFTHLPRSFEAMISMLIRAERLTEADSLLQDMLATGVSTPGRSDLFSEMIKAYAEKWDMKRSIALYDQARCHPEVLLNVSCYRVLLNRLVQLQKAEIAQRIYADMADAGIISSNENHALDFVILTLCAQEKVLEAVNLLKRVKNLGIISSRRSLDLIVDGYSRKRDFEDLLKFLEEWNHVLGARFSCRILSAICRSRGTAEAWSFLHSLEAMGFKADEKTLGVFVRWSCREGNLRNASKYLSEIYVRLLKPDPQVYDAFLCALSKEGMWECLMEVLAEMTEKGIEIELSTFRVVLAGLCMMRRFVEAELILGQMTDKGFLASLSSTQEDNAVSMAFSVLGLSDLGVKIKRDNGLHSSDVEFFDSLGNGLFLSADLQELQTRLNSILDDSMAPNFDLLVEDECKRSGADAALRIMDEATKMGETLSLSTHCKLMKALLTSKPCKVEEAVNVLNEIPDLRYYLDHHTLNLLLVSLSRKGLSAAARMVLDVLLQKRLPVNMMSFMVAVTSYCKEDDFDGFYELWNALKCGYDGWLTELKNISFILHFLIGKEMFEEAFQLFEMVSLNHSRLIPALCSTFIKELCSTGFVCVGFTLVEKITVVAPHVLEQSCYEHLMEEFFREKKFVEASNVINLMLEKDGVSLSSGMWEILVCNLLGFCRIQKDNFRRGLEVSSSLSRALVDELRRIGKCKLSTVHSLSSLPMESILNMMIQHRCQKNDLRGAHELQCLLLKMNGRLGLSAFRDLVSLSCLIGRIDLGLNLKEQMLREQEVPPQMVYNILLFHLFKNEECSAVDLVLDEMRRGPYVHDQFYHNLLVHGYNRCGDGEKSLKCLNAMISKGMCPTGRSLRISMVYLCQQQRLDEALKLFQEIESKAWKHGSVTQVVFMKSLFLSSVVDEVESLLQRLQGKNLIPFKANYDVLVEGFCRLRRVNTSVNLLNLMLEKGGELPSERSYNLVLKGLLTQGALKEALDIHAEMMCFKRHPSGESYEMLIRGLCDQGRTTDAEQLFDAMLVGVYPGVPSHDIFQLVLHQYDREKNVQKATELLKRMQQCGIIPEFEAHWSLISSLSKINKEKREENDDGKGFLSHLLSQTGFEERGSSQLNR